MRPIFSFILKVLAVFTVQLLALELALFLFFSLKQDYDAEMWKYSRDLKVNVGDARAHIHRANGSAKLMGVEVATNEFGLRSFSVDPTMAHSPPYRILALGDSFTLGWGVPSLLTYPALLNHDCKDNSKKHAAINAGVGNYNLEQVAASAERLIPLTRPSAVLYGFYWNDAESVQREPESWLARHSHILLFWRKVQVRIFHYGGQTNSYRNYYETTFAGENWIRFEKSARDLAEWSKLRKIPLYVALLPELRVPDDPAIKTIYEKVETLFQSLGAKTINLFGKLPSRKMTDYWVAPDDPHPNALAHKEIALQIEKQFWPDCQRP